jgi:hypothetical protein
MKNHYILNPGEFFVVDELRRERKDLVLCLPVQDRGWDVLALKKDGTEPKRLQVKESRYYLRGLHSWHQLKSSKMESADVFVFVTYIPIVNAARPGFSKDYMVFPRRDLEEICKKWKNAPRRKYDFYFHFGEDNKVTEIRDEEIDVTNYHRAWVKI